MDVQSSSSRGGSGEDSDRGEGEVLAGLTKEDEEMDEKSRKEANKQKLQVVQDAIRNLDYALLRCDSVEALFGSELMARRNKVKDLCEKTLLESPKALGPVLRDRLWRSVFYDVLGRAKRLKPGKVWTPTQLAYIRNHLLSGIGHMNILMVKLQNLPEVKDSSIRLHVNGMEDMFSTSFEDPNAPAPKQPVRWMIDLLYSFMLNIGDLHRYMTETYAQDNDGDDVMTMIYYDRAQDYYTRAFILNPESGMAHNQLGTLSVKLNGGLDAVYYFLYSMVSEIPYDGAFQNLRQLLDKQLVYFATLPAAIDSKSLDVFAHRYMSMVYSFVFEKMHMNNFEKSCQDSILSFVNLLHDKSSVFDDRLILRVSLVSIMTVWRLQSVGSSAVSAAVAFAIGIFIQLVEKLSVILKEHSCLQPDTPEELAIEINPPTPVAEKTLTLEDPLALGGEETLENDTLASVLPGCNPKSRLPKRRQKNGCIVSENFLHQGSSSEDESDNIDTNNSSRRRRGVRRKSSEDFSDSDLSYSENELWSCSDQSSDKEESEDQGSDPEELVNEDGGAFGDSSEVSDTSYQAEIDRKVAELKLSQTSEENSAQNGNEAETPMKTVITKEALLECWDEIEPILVATLPFMRWFQVAPAVRNAFASNCEKNVLEKFCTVFNLLSSTNWSKVLHDEEDEGAKRGMDEFYVRSTQPSFQHKLQEDWKLLAAENSEGKKLFQYELPEDKSLLGLAAFREVLADLRSEPMLSRNNITVIRIGRFVAFGHWLVATDEFAVIHLDNSFTVPSVNEYKRHVQKQMHTQYKKEPDKRLNKLNKRRSLESKALGRLLQDARSEVPERVRNAGKNRRGEGSGKRVYTEDERVWVFVDLAAVLSHLRIIQNLGRHPKFVIVFPHSVNRALDKLKDTDDEGSKVARIASRWIEQVSYKGSSVRILREHEKSTVNTTYPAVQTRESWEFFEVLESCNYLRSHDMKGLKRPGYEFWSDVRDKYRIFYLTGHSNLTPSADTDRDYDAVATAKASSVYFDRIQRYEGRLGRGRRNRSKKYCG